MKSLKASFRLVRKNKKRQHKGATAVFVFDITRARETAFELCASTVCPLFFRLASLRGNEHCCERPDDVGKTPFLDDVVRNGVGSSPTFPFHCGGCKGWWRDCRKGASSARIRVWSDITLENW